MGYRYSAIAAIAVAAMFSCAVNAAPQTSGARQTSGVAHKAAHAAAPAMSKSAMSKSVPTLYYVDFRAIEDGLVGHTYIAYGRLDSNGQPASAQYADYHPDNGFAGYVMGFVVPITAIMQPTAETLHAKIADSYRVTLRPQDYLELIKLISQTSASRRPWTAFGYNCNDLLADAARAVGLNAPITNLAPYHFLPMLRSMNDETTVSPGLAREGTARSASAR
jgi:hypothetical protein